MARPGTRATTIPVEHMVKPLDSWWTVVLVDPIAIRAVPRLASLRWVTPTRITLVAHLLGVISAVLFAGDWLVAGAVVFEVRFVLDCLDGKLARATGRSSALGQHLDVFGDQVLTVANVVALGWSRSPWAVLLFAASYSLQFHLFDTRERLRAVEGGAKPSERLMQRGWGAALARRRMFPMPTSVDAEHLLLFVAPLIEAAGIDVVEASLWVVSGYFVAQVVRYGASLLRLAATIDRGRVR